jgi:hypothetical protein
MALLFDTAPSLAFGQSQTGNKIGPWNLPTAYLHHV